MIFCNLRIVAVICGGNRLPVGNRLPHTYLIRHFSAFSHTSGYHNSVGGSEVERGRTSILACVQKAGTTPFVVESPSHFDLLRSLAPLEPFKLDLDYIHEVSVYGGVKVAYTMFQFLLSSLPNELRQLADFLTFVIGCAK